METCDCNTTSLASSSDVESGAGGSQGKRKRKRKLALKLKFAVELTSRTAAGQSRDPISSMLKSGTRSVHHKVNRVCQTRQGLIGFMTL